MHGLSQAFIVPVLIPVGTSVPKYRPAVTSFILMMAMTVGFLFTAIMPEETARLFALHPRGPLYQYVTYALLHDGPVHLAVNLYFFWLFAVGLENKIGWWRMACLFALCAIAGGLSHQLFFHSDAPVERPLVGCSGAVFGVIGAYIMLFPFSAVRCFFCMLVIVIPFFARVTNIAAIFFLPVYWLLQLVATVSLFNFAITMDTSGISTSAHLGGLAAGVGLTAAVYGFYAFTQEADDDQAAERVLERRLAQSMLRDRLGEKAEEAVGFDLAAVRDVGNVAVPLQPVQRLVVLRKDREACDTYATVLKSDSMACLSPGTQMDLVRMLIGLDETELAIRALEILLKKFPNEEVAVMARYELAQLFLNTGRHPDRAAALLTEFLATEPPIDLEREARNLLQRLPHARVPTPQSATSSLFSSPPDPSIYAAVQPPIPPPPTPGESPAIAHLDQLFGEPDDTENLAPPENWGVVAKGPVASKSKPKPIANPEIPLDVGSNVEQLYEAAFSLELPPSQTDQPAPDQDSLSVEKSDSGFQVRLEDSDWIRRKGIASTPPEAFPTGVLMPSHEAHPVDLDPASAEAPQRDHTDRTARPAPFPRVDRSDATPTAPDETSPAAFSSALVTSETNHIRAVRLRGDPLTALPADRRYSLILAPGAKVEMSIVIAVMGPTLGLSMDGVHHAVLRRRGILAHGLPLDEARNLARELVHYGQSVALIPEEKSHQFGPALDLFNWIDNEQTVRLGHERGSDERRWDQVICLGGGWVGPQPGTPCRAVLDLFFREPNQHLRLWENTFVFPAEVQGRRHERFLELVRSLVDRTHRAIQTRTLNTWLTDEQDHATTSFSSPIEYDNFLNWHLLAYCVPSKRYEADS